MLSAILSRSTQPTIGCGSGALWSDKPGLSPVRQSFKHYQVLGAVAVLHIVLVYALLNGLLKHVTKSMPAEVFINLMSSPAPFPSQRPHPLEQKPAKLPASIKPVFAPVTESPLSSAHPTEAPDVTPQAEIPVPVTATARPALVAETLPPAVASGIEYIRAPQPAYPVLSRRAHEEGKTLLRVLVNERGLPEKAEIQQTSGSARLDEAARQAVLNALFKPYMDNGKPTAMYALVPIRFQINS